MYPISLAFLGDPIQYVIKSCSMTPLQHNRIVSKVVFTFAMFCCKNASVIDCKNVHKMDPIGLGFLGDPIQYLIKSCTMTPLED